mmetsp:Transcript_9458/g.15929  ORF Transcript_9458/g.15929 Transcript_9458/m.15929 type:complete len:159 (+) Transcript_9458:424-900(+)
MSKHGRCEEAGHKGGAHCCSAERKVMCSHFERSKANLVRKTNVEGDELEFDDVHDDYKYERGGQERQDEEEKVHDIQFSQKSHISSSKKSLYSESNESSLLDMRFSSMGSITNEDGYDSDEQFDLCTDLHEDEKGQQMSKEERKISDFMMIKRQIQHK